MVFISNMDPWELESWTLKIVQLFVKHVWYAFFPTMIMYITTMLIYDINFKSWQFLVVYFIWIHDILLTHAPFDKILLLCIVIRYIYLVTWPSKFHNLFAFFNSITDHDTIMALNSIKFNNRGIIFICVLWNMHSNTNMQTWPQHTF